MSDATIITIVSVLIAGVAGPGITAWATTHGQRRRFGHERAMHDLDATRHAVDSLMEALDDANSATIEALHAPRSVRAECCDAAGRNIVLAYQRLTRVRVRLSDDSSTVKTARELLNRTADLAHAAEDQEFQLADGDPRLREMRAAHDAFYAAAYAAVGARLPDRS